MYQEKKKKEKDSSALTWMHQYEDLKTTLKIAKKDKLHRPVTALITFGQTEQQQKLGIKNWTKNNCMGMKN